MAADNGLIGDDLDTELGAEATGPVKPKKNPIDALLDTADPGQPKPSQRANPIDALLDNPKSAVPVPKAPSDALGSVRSRAPHAGGPSLSSLLDDNRAQRDNARIADTQRVFGSMPGVATDQPPAGTSTAAVRVAGDFEAKHGRKPLQVAQDDAGGIVTMGQPEGMGVPAETITRARAGEFGPKNAIEAGLSLARADDGGPETKSILKAASHKIVTANPPGLASTVVNATLSGMADPLNGRAAEVGGEGAAERYAEGGGDLGKSLLPFNVPQPYTDPNARDLSVNLPVIGQVGPGKLRFRKEPLTPASMIGAGAMAGDLASQAAFGLGGDVKNAATKEVSDAMASGLADRVAETTAQLKTTIAKAPPVNIAAPAEVNELVQASHVRQVQILHDKLAGLTSQLAERTGAKGAGTTFQQGADAAIQDATKAVDVAPVSTAGVVAKQLARNAGEGATQAGVTMAGLGGIGDATFGPEDGDTSVAGFAKRTASRALGGAALGAVLHGALSTLGEARTYIGAKDAATGELTRTQGSADYVRSGDSPLTDARGLLGAKDATADALTHGRPLADYLRAERLTRTARSPVTGENPGPMDLVNTKPYVRPASPPAPVRPVAPIATAAPAAAVTTTDEQSPAPLIEQLKQAVEAAQPEAPAAPAPAPAAEPSLMDQLRQAAAAKTPPPAAPEAALDAPAREAAATSEKATSAPRAYVPESHDTPLTTEQLLTRNVVRGLERAHPDAIAHAAPEMAERVPSGAVLVPLPDHTGSTEANAALADAIAQHHGGADVADVLGHSDMTAEHVPKDRPVVFVNNLETSGAPLTAAQTALGRPDAKVLAFAKGPASGTEPVPKDDQPPPVAVEAPPATPTPIANTGKRAAPEAGPDVSLARYSDDAGTHHGVVPEVTHIMPSELTPLDDDEIATAKANMHAGRLIDPTVGHRTAAGRTGEEWARSVDINDPVDATIYRDGNIKLEDGHHRYLAAQILGKPLAVRLKAINTRNPILRDAIDRINRGVAESSEVPSVETGSAEAPPSQIDPFSGVSAPKPVEPGRIDRPDAPMVKGKDTVIRLGSGEKLEGHYAWMPEESVVGSHDPVSFKPNPELPPGIQNRPYHGPAGKAAREQIQMQQANPDFDALYDTGTSVESGPTVVTPQGVGVAGFGRDMTERGVPDEKRPAMLAARQKAAIAAGVPAEAIQAMPEGRLVRVLSDPNIDVRDPKVLGALNIGSDRPAMKSKSAASEGASRATALMQSPESLTHFASTVDPEATLSEYLGSSDGTAFVRSLIHDGVIGVQEVGRFIDPRSGTVTADGRDVIKHMMYSAAIPNADVLDQAPKVIKQKLEHSIPSIVTTNLTPGYELGPLVEHALALMHTAKATTGSLESHLAQGSLLGGEEEHPAVVQMARFIEGAPRAKLTSAFRQYGTLAKEASGQAETHDMFGGTPATPAQLMKQLFTAPTEPEKATAVREHAAGYEEALAESRNPFKARPVDAIQTDLFGPDAPKDGFRETDPIYKSEKLQKQLAKRIAAVESDIETFESKPLPGDAYRTTAHSLAVEVVHRMLRENKAASLIGAELHTHADLAAATGVLRNPVHEVFHFVPQTGAKIDAISAISSRMAGSTAIFIDHNDLGGFARYAVDLMVQHGSNAFSFIHNHPNGIPTASPADIDVTPTMVAAINAETDRRGLPRAEFRGHLIKNHRLYNVIRQTASGSFQTIKGELSGVHTPDPFRNPTMAVGIGHSITDQDSLLAVAQQLEPAKNNATMLWTGGEHAAVSEIGVLSVPWLADRALTPKGRRQIRDAFFEHANTMNGAVRAFLVLEDTPLARRVLEPLMREGIVTAGAFAKQHADGTTSYRPAPFQWVNPRAADASGRMQFGNETADESNARARVGRLAESPSPFARDAISSINGQDQATGSAVLPASAAAQGGRVARDAGDERHAAERDMVVGRGRHGESDANAGAGGVAPGSGRFGQERSQIAGGHDSPGDRPDRETPDLRRDVRGLEEGHQRGADEAPRDVSGPLTPESVKTWASSVKSQLGLKTFDVYPGANGDLSLWSIEVAKGARKQGLGTKAMQVLTAFADAHNRRITLTPGQPGDLQGITSRARLIDFYKRFGFVLNKGRNKDFAISDLMYREPKPSSVREMAGGFGEDLFGDKSHDEEPQDSLFGDAEGTENRRSLAETEASARNEIGRLKQEMVLLDGKDSYGRTASGAVVARQASRRREIASRLAVLEKLVNRDKAISADEMKTRAAGGDLFGLSERSPKYDGSPDDKTTGEVDQHVQQLRDAGDEKAAANLERFMDGSVVRDRLYRGDFRADKLGTVFKKGRATSGRFYFTDDPDVAGKYATGKQDLQHEGHVDYANWFKVKTGPGKRDVAPLNRAWYSLSDEQRTRLKDTLLRARADEDTGKLTFDGPADGGITSLDHWKHVLGESRGDWLKAAKDVWLDSGALFNDEHQFGDILKHAGIDAEMDSPHESRSGTTPVFVSIKKPLIAEHVPADVADAIRQLGKRDRSVAKPGYDMWDKNSITLRDWITTRFGESLDNDNGTWATQVPEKVTKLLQAMGYDGIRHDGGVSTGGKHHHVWIAFEPNQIKSAVGNNGTFDANTNSIIREQQSMFSAGEPDDEYATGVKNAVSAETRKSLGVGERIRPEPRTQKEMYDAGKATAAADPTAIARLLTDLRENPEKIVGTKTEAGLLLKHRVDLDNKLTELVAAKDAAVKAGDEPAERLARLQLAEHREAVKEFVELAERTGTASGRALAARKMMSKLDYSLSHMEAMAEAAKGSSLTQAELERIKKLHEELVVKLAAAEKDAAAANERAAEAEADLHHAQLRATAMAPVMDRVSAKLGTAADAAKARIRARGMRAMAGMDPVDLADHAIIGADALARGVIRFADWSKSMKETFGDEIAPHLRDLFEASNAHLNTELKKARALESRKPTAPKAKVPKAKVPADIRGKLKARLEGGAAMSELKPYLRQLALEHIRDGIVDREPLLDALHQDVLATGASVTRTQTRDALSGYGDFRPLDKSEDRATLRDIRAESQKLAQLEALQKGQAPLATGFERQAPNDETRKLTKQVNDAKKAAGLTQGDDASRLKSALGAAKTRTRNAIADLRTEIDTGERMVRGKSVLIGDAELETLKDELAELRKQETEVFGTKTLTDAERLQRAIVAAKRTAEMWEERVKLARGGQLSPRGRSELMNALELNALRAKATLAREQYKELAAMSEPAKEIHPLRAPRGPRVTGVDGIERSDEGVELGEGTAEEIDPAADITPTGSPDIKKGAKDEHPAVVERRKIEAANQRYRTYLAKREAELLDRLARADYSPRALPAGTRYDRESQVRKAEVEEVKQRYQDALRKFEKANRTRLEKLRDGAVSFTRASVLSSPDVILKLTAVALSRIVTTPATDAVALGVANALPGLAKGAPRYGTRSAVVALRAEAAAQVAMWTDGLIDAGRQLVNKQSRLTLLHGKHKLPHAWYEYAGSVHAALKEPVKRAEYARALYRLTFDAMQRGENTTDDFVKLRLSTEAYLHAEGAVAMNDNIVTDAWKAGLQRLERKDPKTGKKPMAGLLLSGALKTDMPIMKAPTNVIIEASEFIAGLPLGAAKAAWAYAHGIEDLKPVERDSIIRLISKGAVGLAIMALYFYKHDDIDFGGFYQRGEHRAADDVPADAMRIGTRIVPKTFLHNPVFYPAQFAATTARLANTRLHKNDEDPVGYQSALMAATVGLLEQVPIAGGLTNDLGSVFDPKRRDGFLEKKAASIMVPSIIQWIAKKTDPDGDAPRKPVGLKQHIQVNLPIWRQQVPIDEKKQRRMARLSQ